MTFIKKLNTFSKLPSGLLWLFVKALFFSAVIRFTLLFLNFSKVMKWLGKPNTETPSAPDPGTLRYRKWIIRAMNLCNRYSFWKTECYTQALTAKLLLRGKNIGATVYIGFQKDRVTNKYKGHAWLRSADTIITGKESMSNFDVHSYFS